MENIRIVTALALLCATSVNALTETDGSYYEIPGGSLADKADQAQPTIEELYGYYYGGSSVVTIIFLDVLLPIVCCVGIIVTIVCVIKHVNRRRQLERQQDHEQNR